MARILINSIHDSLFVNQIRAMVALGHKLVVPMDRSVFTYGRTHAELIEVPESLMRHLSPIDGAELEQQKIDIAVVRGR